MGAYAPIGAETITGGFEVAFKAGSDSYTVWNTDAKGNITTNALGTTSGGSAALESLETSFHQDLNGDGTIGVVSHGVTTVWTLSDGGKPVSMAAGNFFGNGSDQLAVSYASGTYIRDSGNGFTKIDGGTATLMAAGDFFGTGASALAIYFPNFGTYIRDSGNGFTKIDTGTPLAFTTGDYSGNNVDQLATSFAGAGTFLWSASTGFTKINSGAATLLATGDFNGNGKDDIAAYIPGSGTFVYENGAWSQIDSGAVSQMVAGDFYGDGHSEIAAYFAGSGTYIWKQGLGFTKIDSGTVAGLGTETFSNPGQDQLLAYFPGSGMYRWTNTTSWSKANSTNILPTNGGTAILASGHLNGGYVNEPAVFFTNANGLYIDPPADSTTSAASATPASSAPQTSTSASIPAADATATHVADSAPASTTTTTASLTFTPSNTSSVSQPDAAHAGNDLTSSSVLSHGSAGQNFVFTETAASLQNGGQVHNFVFAAAPEAAPAMGGAMPAPATSTITDFHPGIDKFDFSAVAGLNTTHQSVDVHFIQGQTAPDTIAPHTIDVVSNGGNTTLYANAGDVAETISSGHADI